MTEEDDNTPELGSPIADPNAPHVGPNYLPGCVIGYSIGGINDGREAIAENLSISKYEAEILYRHWFDTYRDVAEFFEVTGQSGSAEWRTSRYSDYRLEVLEPHCSAEFLREIEEEAARRDKQVAEDRAAFEREMEGGPRPPRQSTSRR